MAKAKSSKKGKTKGKGKKKSRVVQIDMEGIESSSRVSDGDYKLTVEEIEIKESQESGNEYLNFIFKVAGGGKVYHICSLQPQALFNLRSTLEALEVEVPDSVMDIDLDELEGLVCAGSIANEVYQGKKNPKVIDLFPLSELDEDADEADEEEEEEEEDEPEEKPKKSKKGKKEKKGKKKGKIKVGSDVIFEDGDDEMEGTVTEIDDDVVTVEDEDGEEWEVELSDVKLA